MKTGILLFLAASTVARAINFIGDQIVVRPFTTPEPVNVVGRVTLSQPGTYTAAAWNVVAQLRFGAPGDYTIVATRGSINIAGQMISTGGPATLAVRYAGRFNLIAGNVPNHIKVVDQTCAATSPLPPWLQNFTVAVGDYFVLTPPVGTPGACQWRRNGELVPGATQPTLTLTNVRPSDAGVYTLDVVDNGATRTIVAGMVAIQSTVKVVGDAVEVGSDVRHSNGGVYDQFMLTGASATVRADRGQTTRLSFLDLTDDIVQVEFSGAGSLTVVLSNPSGPELPAKYNQQVRYMKGHATLVVADADSTTNVSVFSVGRANAVNQGLFRPGVSYDGIADIALLGIASQTGQTGGIFLGNAHCFGAGGIVGVFAGGVDSWSVVRIGNVCAFDRAIPVLVFGRADEVQITGGDLKQENARAVEIGGVGRVRFSAGATSDGVTLGLQVNQARLVSSGVDVTAAVVTP